MIYMLESPLGKLYAAFNDRALIKLSFEELKEGAEKNSVNEKLKTQLQKELYLYFNHKLKTFTVPIELKGTEFQLEIWNQLQTISFGKTISYKEQANEIGNIKAIRAVASANGSNPIAIIVPCHRVIEFDGSLTGYAGGLEKKKWLLQHEGNQLQMNF